MSLVSDSRSSRSKATSSTSPSASSSARHSRIVSALVADLIMPVVALVMPSGDWRASGIVLRQAANPKDNVVLKYGDFLGSILDFFVLAVVLFIVVSKIVKVAEAKLSKAEEAVTKECKFCLEIVRFKATRCKACTSELGAVSG